MDTPCQFLEWDSTFFKLRIARVNGNHLNPENADKVDAWCLENKIDCLYFLADGGDQKTIRLTEDHGFHFTDFRVVFRREINKGDTIQAVREPYIIRPARENDVSFLKSIARTNFHSTRFYHDENFPRELCDALYETWIEKSYYGYANAVLIVENEAEICGFVTLKISDPKTGEIGLIGVNPKYQGRGIGQIMVNEGLCWFAERSISCLRVTTQGCNSHAQRLYERCGFLTESVDIWFHKWFHQNGLDQKNGFNNVERADNDKQNPI
jgi:dTDP-4-amino-4,6-dideoxy-D-galactose acyltransferase